MRESEYLIPKDDLLNRLKSVPTLSPFEDEDLQVLIRYSKIRQYDPGDVTGSAHFLTGLIDHPRVSGIPIHAWFFSIT